MDCNLSDMEVKEIVNSIKNEYFDSYDFIFKCPHVKLNTSKSVCGKRLSELRNALGIVSVGHGKRGEKWRKGLIVPVPVNTQDESLSDQCETYTVKLKRRYLQAVEKNKELSNIYYCAIPGRLTPRDLDYKTNAAFCETGKIRSEKTDCKEYKLQALLVKIAKQNDWILPIYSKEWELVDAERNFAKTKSPKKPDLIAYDKKEKKYIIVELKGNNLSSSIKKAITELDKYPGLLDNEIFCANSVYNKKVLKGDVVGYILLPNAPKIDCKYGVITFDDSKGLSENLTFHVTQEPK